MGEAAEAWKDRDWAVSTWQDGPKGPAAAS